MARRHVENVRAWCWIRLQELCCYHRGPRLFGHFVIRNNRSNSLFHNLLFVSVRLDARNLIRSLKDLLKSATPPRNKSCFLHDFSFICTLNYISWSRHRPCPGFFHWSLPIKPSLVAQQGSTLLRILSPPSYGLICLLGASPSDRFTARLTNAHSAVALTRGRKEKC